jgi:hypothetical protein
MKKEIAMFPEPLHPELRDFAHRKVQRCIKNGMLRKPERCSKCRQKSDCHAHHADYSKPLYVIWLCQGCHTSGHHKLHEYSRPKHLLTGARTRLCSSCGHNWRSRVQKPKACPRCKSYRWRQELKTRRGGKT